MPSDIIRPPRRCPGGSWRLRTDGPAPAIAPAPRAARWTGWSSSWDGPWAWWATLVPLLGEPWEGEEHNERGLRRDLDLHARHYLKLKALLLAHVRLRNNEHLTRL